MSTVSVDDVVDLLNVDPSTISGSTPNRTFYLFETAVYEGSLLAWIRFATNYIHPLIGAIAWDNTDPLVKGLVFDAVSTYATFRVLTYLLPAVPVKFFDYKLGPLSKRRTDAATRALSQSINYYKQLTLDMLVLLRPMSLSEESDPIPVSQTSPPVGL